MTIDAQPAPAGQAKQKFVNRRARALYGRFKRSKDLAAYSTDDLSCILGEQDKRPDRFVAVEATVEETAAVVSGRWQVCTAVVTCCRLMA